MAKTIRVAWEVVLDEDNWDTDEEVVFPLSADDPAPRPADRYWLHWPTLFVLWAFAIAAGIVFWVRVQNGLAAVERGLAHTLALELQAQVKGHADLAGILLDPEADPRWLNLMEDNQELTEQGVRVEAKLVDFVLHGDRAMARVKVREVDSGKLYWEHRFYRETASGWLRSQPTTELWGDPQILESVHFVFHFRRLEGPAVAEAALLLDTAYAHMQGVMGRTMPAAANAETKVHIHVTAAGESYGDGRVEVVSQFWVNSPRQLIVPDGITDGRVLAESGAIELRRATVNRMISPLGRVYQPAPAFLSGLRLWLAWEEELAQSEQQHDLVTWFYSSNVGNRQDLPFSYRELCNWLYSYNWVIVVPTAPMGFHCPFEQFLSLSKSRPPVSLRDLPLGLSLDELVYSGSHASLTGAPRADRLGQPIAVATLLDYTTNTYGQDSVRVLLQAAQAGESWCSAATKFFGVSADEFEAGWRAWLISEYAVIEAAFASDLLDGQVSATSAGRCRIW